MTESFDLTAQLCHRTLTAQPNATARAKARDGVQDWLAALWPVITSRRADRGLAVLQSVYTEATPATRALLLGYAGHALDYDDFHAGFHGHPSAVILAALLAWASAMPHPRAVRLLDAYIIGVELAGRLGLALTPRHYRLGYHNTASLGVFAAAAALARFASLDVRQTAVLFGLAATSASGLRAQFGSAVKPLHVGLAAERAVRAAQLAQAGLEGRTEGVLEAFLALASAGAAEADRLLHDWGAPWRIVTPGLEFKPFPVCAGTHSAALAARQLRQRGLARFGTLPRLLHAIAHISVAFPPGADLAASVHQPRSGIEARFSLEYIIAAMLIHNDLRADDFADGPPDPAILALAARVTRHPDPHAPPDACDPTQRFHTVTLTFADGDTLSQRCTRRQVLAKPVKAAHKLRQALTAQEADVWLRTSRLRTDADLRQLLILTQWVHAAPTQPG